MSKKLFQGIRKRAMIGAALFVLLSCVILTRHTLFRLGVQTYLSKQCPMDAGWEFTYDEITVGRGGVHLLGLHLRAKDDSFEYLCDDAHLFAKHLKGVHFDMHLDMPESKVIFREIEGAPAVSPDILWTLLKNPVRLKMEEGKISMITKSGNTGIYFSLFGEKSSSALGTFFLSSQQGVSTEPEAMVKCFGWPGEKIIKFEADQCQLPWLSKFLTFFSILDTSAWQITEGTIGGHLWLGWQGEKDLSQLTAKLHLEGIGAECKEHGLDLAIKDIECDLSFPSGKRINEDLKWKPLQNLALNTQITEGRIGFKDSTRGSEFAIADIGGVICLNSLNHSEIALKGFLEQQEQMHPIVIAGNPSLIDPNSLKLDLKLLLEPDSETKLGMSIAFTDDDSCIIKGQLKEISTQQVSMFQHILGFAYPEVKDVEFAEGTVTCEMSLWLGKEDRQRLYLDELSCDNLQVYLRSQDILGFCSHLGGSAQIDLNALPSFQFPNWDLQITNGDVVMGREGNVPLAFCDVDLDIVMRDASFDLSMISFTYEGMQTKCQLIGDSLAPDIHVNMGLDGQRLLKWFGNETEGSSDFAKYQIGIDTSFIREEMGWYANGMLELAEEKSDTFHYQFCLSDQVRQIEGSDPLAIFRECISEGSFFAKDVSLQAANFVRHLTDSSWDLSGQVSLEGAFDPKMVTVNLATDQYAFHSKFGDVIHESALVQGSFQVDLEKKSMRGHMPIRSGIFYEKWMDVCYRDIYGELFIDHDQMHIEEVSTEVEGLLLGGKIALDFASSAPKLDLDIASAVGTLKQLDNLTRHIPGFTPLQIPLDGRISLEEGGFHLDCHLGKEDVFWRTQLALSHGNVKEVNGLGLQDVSLSFTYDSDIGEMQIARCRGHLQTADQLEGYSIYIPQISVLDSSGTFDMRLENEMLDMARLVGAFDLATGECAFDTNSSHLYSEPLKRASFTYDQFYGLTALDLALNIPMESLAGLEKFLCDLSLFHTGAPLLKNKGVSGQLNLELQLMEEAIHCHITGDGVSAFGVQPMDLFFHGEKVGSSWRISEAQFGELSIRGALIEKDQSLFIDLLRVDHPKYQATFQGDEINFVNRSLKLGLSEASLSLNDFSEYSGNVEASGELQITLTDAQPFLELGAELSLNIDNFLEEAYQLRSSSPLRLTFAPNEGLNIIDSDFSLQLAGGEEIGSLHLPFMSLFEKESMLRTQNAFISLKSSSLEKELERRFPGLQERLPKVESSNLSLYVSLVASDGNVWANGNICGGEFSFAEQKIQIDDVEFGYEPNRLHFGTVIPFTDETLYASCDMSLQGKMETHVDIWPIIDKDLVDRSTRAMYLNASLREEEGIVLHRIGGDLLGCKFSFHPKKGMSKLLGYVDIDAKQLYPVLPKDAQKVIDNFGLHKGLGLLGEIAIDRDNLLQSSFTGAVLGKEFDALGYQLNSLLADVSLNAKSLHVKDIRVTDDAVMVSAPEITLWEKEVGDWHIKMPELLISDLRPSLLKQRQQSYQRIKPFKVKKLHFQDVEGSLLHSENITGKGFLSFVNTFKREHNLLDIPKDIISRIGLDPVLLVPIQGDMDFVFDKGRLLFTKLRNSYSESKRSYFYLWHKSESYLDFHGNIHIDIRMKQHVLFKITQLFILSIGGDLEKPRFSLK